MRLRGGGSDSRKEHKDHADDTSDEFVGGTGVDAQLHPRQMDSIPRAVEELIDPVRA
jgi:hypothetical protein